MKPEANKAIPMRRLRPMGLEAPGPLSNIDSYEIYVRITPIRYLEMSPADGSLERVEQRGESFGCVSYVSDIQSKEAGLLLYLIRSILQIVAGFFGVDL